MARSHDFKRGDTFTDDPPPWAREVFSEGQRERLTFTKLWQKSVAASGLTKAAKLVALALSLYFSGNEDDDADPSTARLADETSMHRSTVISQLDMLDEAGFIARLRSAGRVRTRYRLTVPNELPAGVQNRTPEPDLQREQPSDETTVGTDDSYGSEDGQLSDSASQLSDSPPQLSDSAPPTVAPSDLKGLEGFTEGKSKGGGTDVPPGASPNGEKEGQDQHQDQEQEPPEEKAFRYGEIVGRDPRTERSQAEQMLDKSGLQDEGAFWEGFEAGRRWDPSQLPGNQKAEVAS